MLLSFLLAVVITYIARLWLTITSQLSTLIASSDVENNKLIKALQPAATSPIKDCRPPWPMVLHYIKRWPMKEKRRKDDCRSTGSSLTNPFISCPYSWESNFFFLSCTPIVYLIMHLTCGIKILNGSLSQNILQGLCMELTDYETQVLCDKFDPGKEGRWVVK